MEVSVKVLENVLPNATLDELILTASDLQTLNDLLKIKHQRFLEGKCEKLNFSISLVYDANEFNINEKVQLSTSILEKALTLTTDNVHIIERTVKYCLHNLNNSVRDNDESYYNLCLLYKVLNYYKNRNLCFKGYELESLNNSLIKFLEVSKPLYTYVLIVFLPKYLLVIDENCAQNIFSKLLDFVIASKKLEIFCFTFEESAKFLLNQDTFWELLATCISNSKDSSVQKEATYLLNQSVQFAIKTKTVPEILKAKGDTNKIWRDFFVLLDVCKEKQLYFVEPSLHLFASIKNLELIWRLGLYKLFLNHSQNAIVYNVANFILLNESEWENFSKIMNDLLMGLNKNEYNPESITIFKQIGNLCKNLHNTQIESFLNLVVKVNWVPVAIWALYSNLFNENTNFEISVSLLENILRKLKALPHKFIRYGCFSLILKYFLKNYKINEIKEFLKVLSLLRVWKPIFDDPVFTQFIESNRRKILQFESVCLLTYFANDLKSNRGSDSEIIIKLLRALNIVLESTQTSIETDLFYLLSEPNLNELENYIIQRIKFVEKNENITILLKLIHKYCTQNFENVKAFLLENELNFVQRYLAFKIFSLTNANCDDHIFKFYKPQLFVYDNYKSLPQSSIIVLKYLSQLNLDAEIDQEYTILEQMLEKNAVLVAVPILENFSPIFKFIHKKEVFAFVERCFNEHFPALFKTNEIPKSTTTKFFSQIFQNETIFNDTEFCNLLLQFCQRLLTIANNFNAVASSLAEILTQTLKKNPNSGEIFVEFIVELILYGPIINKTDRVEYCVCQEIPLENNPNFDRILTRGYALEAMLVLVKHSEELTDKFVSLLVHNYKKHFSKRYFPDSKIHFEKLRIIQSLLVIHEHVKSQNVMGFIIESFLMETHQPSIKHLMQWLLILLAKDDKSAIKNICAQLEKVDNNRPSTVSALIPVLYYLISKQDEKSWDRIVDILLPYTMGAQFKLRIFSQVALIKIYEKATQLQHTLFIEKYFFLNESLKKIADATQTICDCSAVYDDFLDYFTLISCDFSTIFYIIPKHNNVNYTEWENLHHLSQHQFKYVKFTHTLDPKVEKRVVNFEIEHIGNIQKKITPWKELLENQKTEDTNFILVTSLIQKPTNLGGLSRTCEVFGFKKMVMRTAKTTQEKEFQSLSMSSENWLDISEVKIEALQDLILKMKEEGYSVIGAEQTACSVKLDTFQFPKKTVLLLGNEKEGIPPNIIPLMDFCVEIPQFGMVRSLNVHVAGAIIMWEYCKQHKL